MKNFHLIEGKISIDNTHIKTDKNTTWNKIKGMVFSIVGVFYLYDRITLKLEKEHSLDHLIFTCVVYGILTLLVLFLIYFSWFKTVWSNKIKIENLSKLTISLDEDSPRNIDFELKGKFSTIAITFRQTEDDYKQFIEYLKKRNSRFIIRDERI